MPQLARSKGRAGTASKPNLCNYLSGCTCGSTLPQDVEKHLGTKLHETGCRKKGIWSAAADAAAAPAEEAAPQTPLNHPSFAMLVRSKFARGIEAGCRRCWWKATVGCNTATGRGWGQFLWMVMKVLRMMSLGDADARA